MRRSLVLTVLLAIVLSACARSGADESTSARPAGDRQPTTTEAPASSTTEAPTTVPPTTAAPVALVDSGAKAVVTPSGVVVPVLGREGDALLVGTPCERTAHLRDGQPLQAVDVVLDAGHGGREPGAVGPAGLTEKEVNLLVANETKRALEAGGYSAVLTRTADYRMTLEARAKIVRSLQPKAFVSVHHNAEPDGPFPKPGAETYYQVASPDSKRLAGLLYEELVKAFSAYDISWVADTDAGAKYRKSSSGDDYYGILRRTQGTPAVLSEAAFINNPPEEALLRSAEFQKVEGEAIARAIVRFLTTSDPGSGFTEPYPRESPAGSGGGKSPACEDPVL